MEPVMDVEKVPKPRWKLVSPHPRALTKANLGSIATSVNREWELASSAAIRIALLPFM
jgi:hypothetical protein